MSIEEVQQEIIDEFSVFTDWMDKLAKTNVIHKNKANNLKSKLAIYINKLV